MNKSITVTAGLIACLMIAFFFPVHSQADNDFSTATNAMQQQGFIRPDTGGQVGGGEMALNNFRESDLLRFGGILGPLDGVNDQFLGPNPNGSPVDSRDIGFGSGQDSTFVPINVNLHSD